MLFHDTKTSSSPVYNELYGNIELDSVHADLFTDYLNYFLPVSERDVNFPTYAADSLTNQMTQANSTAFNPVILPTHRHHHTNLFKRKMQKLITNPATSGPSSTAAGAGSSDELSSMLGETDRLGDMKKIDRFLRLVNEFLIYPFTDMSTGPASQQIQSLRLADTFTSPNIVRPPSPNHMATSSPLKYADPTQYLANIEIIFALSMLLKHSHLFCNAFISSIKQVDANCDQLNEAASSSSFFYAGAKSRVVCMASNSQYECPTDEFRAILFKSYWRKPFYKFLQFHFVHWPLTASLKWVVELWFTYIQPWKFTPATSVKVEPLTSNIVSDFMKENYLVYTDIYQLIIKRHCIVDYTIEDNLQNMQQILDVRFTKKRSNKKRSSK